MQSATSVPVQSRQVANENCLKLIILCKFQALHIYRKHTSLRMKLRP